MYDETLKFEMPLIIQPPNVNFQSQTCSTPLQKQF